MLQGTECQRNFYPRPPRGGRRPATAASSLPCAISIHALREEGDLILCLLITSVYQFLSTPSARRATFNCSLQRLSRGGFLSTPSARRATSVSTALRQTASNFYPRPPRGGRPTTSLDSVTWTNKFLSTPSARRATAKTERKHPAFVSLYTSLHKLQRDVCKPNRKITPLLAQTAGVPVRSVPENHVCCRFALAGHQKISTLSCANSGCSPTCSTFV